MRDSVQGHSVSAWVREVFRSGTVAALVMIPFGLAFRALGLRVNEYGMAVIRALFGAWPAGVRFALFAIEHFVIAWIAAVPLLLALRLAPRRASQLLLGALYGAGFYVAINSLALPWLFGDPTPWQLGFEVVAPSLVLHLAYGLSIAVTARGFVNSRTPAPAHRNARA